MKAKSKQAIVLPQAEAADTDQQNQKEVCDCKKLRLVMKSSGLDAFEYRPAADTLVLYDDTFRPVKVKEHYLLRLKTDSDIRREDRWKAGGFFRGRLPGPIKICCMDEQGKPRYKILQGQHGDPATFGEEVFVGSIQDVTRERMREKALQQQAERDPLTGLYNHAAGKELIEDYLSRKDPMDSCALIVMDVDYFKQINDVYGHLFGDRVLQNVAQLLPYLFKPKDILARYGGDEFVILLKGISHIPLVKAMIRLVEEVRALTFDENNCRITCSAGVCYLPENTAGYTYDQLFENADWALYQAKLNGRNGYAFCDNLQRFKEMHAGREACSPSIDPRYLQSDMMTTAFDIFDKTSNFDTAIKLLLEVIGLRFHLDRITIINADVRDRYVSRNYQWCAEGVPEALRAPDGFSREDFLTLYRSYDEYGTTVLDEDDMEAYSPQGRELLMQGGAKTVVYAAMYCRGKYIGAISYVVCSAKRPWSNYHRSQLGELTKIISAHLVQNTAGASADALSTDHDTLTGLITFSRFREELERLIVSGKAHSHFLVYTDFENFRYVNRMYGYHMGDRVLKAFSDYLNANIEEKQKDDILFCRITADQFLLYHPYTHEEKTKEVILHLAEGFEEQMRDQFPDAPVRLRCGVYAIPPTCSGATAAVDAANFARKSIIGTQDTVCCYDSGLSQEQDIKAEVIIGFEKGLADHSFEVFLQPKFSLEERTLQGAEALVRLRREDGTLLSPDAFVPFYEANGKIIDLDYYVFERVAEFLAEGKKRGRKQYPISVNASGLHTTAPDTVARYLEIARRYGVDPGMIEIELTETAAVRDYQNARKMFEDLRAAGFRIALDDFGSGHSVLSMVADIPIDVLKLDHSLATNCMSNTKGQYLLSKIIDIGRGLGYSVICEGVETEQQAQMLLDAGCRMGQGYLFSRPLSIPDYLARFYPEDHA